MSSRRTNLSAENLEDSQIAHRGHKRSILRLRRGVRWQAERDAAFDGVASFELDIKADSKAVSQPPQSKTLRRFEGLMLSLALLLAAAILLITPHVRGQQLSITGGATDFNSVEYYGAPYQQDIKRLFSGAEAQPLPGGLLLVKKAKIEIFDLTGKLQWVAEAPECIYDPVNVIANSPGEIHVRNGDGQLKIDGEGFLWRQNDSMFTISNQVQTMFTASNRVQTVIDRTSR